MTQKYEPVIGLEIHAELITASKMFCSCSADYASAPDANTNICPVCTALPGAMPVINKKAVEQAILVGMALNCSINLLNNFARKNYFYPDLPKGYQISQYELPIAANGWIDVPADSGDGQQHIHIRRAHLEEDTAKTFHRGEYALIDYNRAGVPLLEIVTEPDMHTVEAALAYATKIRAILRTLGVNSGDMEKGVLRFEANVSVRPIESDQLRTRTEIKNLNSFRALTRASTYEIQRQIALYESGKDVMQETLGWDEARGVTVSQRSKEHAHDYRYFPEPDLPPLELSQSYVESFRAHLPELPDAKTERFIREYGLKPQDATLLASEKSLAEYFESVVAQTRDSAKTVSNWVTGELLHQVNELSLSVDAIPVPAAQLAELINLVFDKLINGNTAKSVLIEMFKSGRAPKEIVESAGLSQISDEGYLKEVVAKIVADNPKEVASYLGGKETLTQWFMGQVARVTKGKADPQAARELLVEALEKSRK
ncbi:MAG TPA: Asp-tRNA(Asn)/Glu-tRNA(Gln) amidotransferase subunit GatB [Anaerolineales bacterium]|nr:Asp-tRNA(Asn)/Glu-tRNA(Gln) amidotransferase subunit GatB [Anaerolineales bacterium]